MNLNHINTLAVHECIHFLQELKDKKGNLIRLGLYELKGKNHGMAINEAAVQLMASKATNMPLDTVRYYNMNITTESPDYYPLETAIIREMTYFTGTYPLFHSVLYSNDVFKNTFIAKSNNKTYYYVVNKLDLLLHYQEKLALVSYDLQHSSEDSLSLAKIKKLSNKIEALKSVILKITLEIQNTIILNCFNNEFNYIKDNESLKNFQNHLYNFKDFLIDTDGYNYYNQFYIDMMNRLDEKRELIKKYGVLTLIEDSNKNISLLQNPIYGFEFFKKLFLKLKLIAEEKNRIKE